MWIRQKIEGENSGTGICCFDSSRELSQEDKMLMEELQGVPAVAIVKKSDLQTVADLNYIKEKFSHVVFISAISGDGLKQLEGVCC